jgi:2,5-furandicarboxylate decarboxylase 1
MSSFGDKLSVAGGLRGEAVELTKAETVEVEVPAHAMFVIEGQILPRLRERDGPFGESSGYYIAAENPVIKVSAITHQRNPIYTFFQPLTREEELLLEVALGKDALNLLKMVIPSLQDVAPLPMSAGLVLSIRKSGEDEGRQALQAALSASDYLKYAIVVDDDVDVHDPKQVAWALYGRFQPDRDILILQKVKGSVIDPSVGEDYLSAKMGLDATMPLEGAERFERAVVPQAVEAKIAPLLQRYFGL